MGKGGKIVLSIVLLVAAYFIFTWQYNRIFPKFTQPAGQIGGQMPMGPGGLPMPGGPGGPPMPPQAPPAK